MDTNLATPRVRSGRVVIAGGGLAGQRCAEALRRKGFDGQITIICAEARRPYDRPPLSKELLEQAPLGDAPSFRSVEWYERESVQLSLGVSATDLVPGERRLSLSDGSSLRYDWLVIATGSRPRRLPLLDGYDNVSVLRTLDDCQRLRDALAQRPRLAVIGAGFIGQEVAATARRLGLSVTMIEAAPCPLIGVLGVQLGEWFERLHREEGVEMLMSRTVDGVSANGTVRALRLSDHSVVEADHIVVGVGVEPDIAWLHDSGLTVDGLIPVDPHGRTAADRVLAIGDAAATFDPLAGRHLPGSHWEAAGRQGTRAAHGRPTNHDSGAGQYSVTVTPPSQAPRACLRGAPGIRPGACVGASPPTDAPPLAPGLPLGRPLPPPAALAASAGSSAATTASIMTSRARTERRWLKLITICSRSPGRILGSLVHGAGAPGPVVWRTQRR